ncbi:MAG: beta strand repeat-containing protein, partial [Actinomycetota bacterium]
MTGTTIANKQYNASAAAGTLTLGTLTGFVGTETVTAAGLAGDYASANVGTRASTVTYTLSDGDNGGLASNYSLASQSVNGTITAKPLSITAPTIASKVYNASDAAGAVTVGTLSGFVSPETVTATAVAANYSSANVGSYAGVVVTYTLVDGTNGGLASNYSLATGTATGEITAKPLSITAPTIASRAYNGLTTAGSVTVGTLSGFVGTQTVTATGAAAVYGSKDIGTYSTTVTYTLSDGLNSGRASNYSLATDTANGTITAQELLIRGSFEAADKFYDGSRDATVASRSLTLNGLVTGEDVGLNITLTFDTKDVGATKTVSISAASLTGTAKDNYSLTLDASRPTDTAAVNKLALSITAPTIASKEYNASAVAGAVTVGTLSGFVGSETVTATAVAANYSSANVGSYAGVVVTYTLADGSLGGLASNYSLANGSATGVITAKPLSITAPTIVSRAYNGSTTAGAVTVGTLSGFVGSETVTATGAAANYTSAAIGSYPGVVVTYTLGNGDNGGLATNYSLATGSATGTVTAKELTLTGSFTVTSKVYDRSVTASINSNLLSLVGVETGDTVTLVPVIEFDTRNVGTSKTVTLKATSSLTGASATNYSLSLTGAPTSTGNITEKLLSIGGSLTAASKVYDDTTAATLTTTSLTLSGVVSGDGAGVSLTGISGAFSDENVGTGKTVSITVASLTGAEATNYSLTIVGAPTASANITAKALTITGLTADNKEYDGNRTAAVSGTAVFQSAILGGSGTSVDGKPYTGDAVTISGTAVGTFADQNVADGISVSFAGLALAGDQSGNYTLTAHANGSANITKRALTITGSTIASRQYDGTTAAAAVTVGTVTRLVTGEALTITATAASYSDSIVGTYPGVVITYTLNDGVGGESDNYSAATGTASAQITRKLITITADALNKTYSTPAASDPTFTYVVSPSITGMAALSGVLSRTAGETAGQYDV